MAEVKGKKVFCDRCGKEIFLKTTGDGETDGGFTRWNEFEPMPVGWQHVTVPGTEKYTNGNRHDKWLLTCPDCSQLWFELLNENYLYGTKYYITEKGIEENAE